MTDRIPYSTDNGSTSNLIKTAKVLKVVNDQYIPFFYSLRRGGDYLLRLTINNFSAPINEYQVKLAINGGTLTGPARINTAMDLRTISSIAVVTSEGFPIKLTADVVSTKDEMEVEITCHVAGPSPIQNFIQSNYQSTYSANSTKMNSVIGGARSNMGVITDVCTGIALYTGGTQRFDVKWSLFDNSVIS